MGDAITLIRIRDEIRTQRFHHADERELETALETVLTGLGLTVERQVRLDPHNRIDIATTLPGDTRLGIEVKVAGGDQDVRRQCRRYAEFDQVDALMLVTTRARHLGAIMPWIEQRPEPYGMSRWLLDGKPFEVAVISPGLL